MARRPAEYREYGIADEFLTGATDPHDRLRHRGERRGHSGADLLRIVLGEHPDVIHDVREQCGHDPAVPGDATAGAYASGQTGTS